MYEILNILLSNYNRTQNHIAIITIFVEVTQCILKYFKLFAYVTRLATCSAFARSGSGSRDPLEYLRCYVLVHLLRTV